jgi:hypothetical protein
MPVVRLICSFLAAAVLAGLPGCGFVLREEAIPEVLPTTTLPPSERPEGPPADDGTALPFTEAPDDFVPIPQEETTTTTTTQPIPEYVGISEDALEVSAEAAPVCRLGALVVYFGTNVLTIALEQSGDPVASADEGEVRDGLEKTMASMRDAVPLLAEAGAQVPSPAQLRRLFAGFDQMIAADSQDELLIIRYRKWWIENERILTQLTAALAETCADEAYAQRLDAWR